MKIVGLITEYNPFHNGHKYHIEKAKEITGADYCIAVMSGDFVQRGAPAFLPKHLRTDMALHGGCDMIIELPVCYATGSAEYFATGAISILDNLGCVDYVCFGSECGNYAALEKIAQTLADEPSEYKLELQNSLKTGLSFPVARQQALIKYFKDDFLVSVISEPNNILGIEYIKAMITNNSSMKGYTISRIDSSYHDEELSSQYSSASAIRNIFRNPSYTPAFDLLNGQLSEYSINIMKKHYGVRYPVHSDDFSLLLKYKLLTESKESLSSYLDITPELANRIINFRNEFISTTQFIDLIKTKEITYSRISRCMIHILLNIKEFNPSMDSYAHILGFKKESSELFSEMKKCSNIPLITKLSSVDQLNDWQQSMLHKDIFASDLYESIVSDKFKTPFMNELTKQIVKH